MRKCVTELKSRKGKFEGGKRLDTRMENSVRRETEIAKTDIGM